MRSAPVATRRRGKVKAAKAAVAQTETEATITVPSTEPRWSLWGDTDS